jgi:PAS domain S-box-containing protein
MARWQKVLAVCAILLATVLPASAREKATVQLKWRHHFQFAGYYAAVEKGFYRDAGLDVTLIEGGPTIDVEQEVAEGRADFGVGTSAILLSRSQGKDLVVLAQIFQHSPAIFLTPRKTGIRSIADMRGRRFMYAGQHGDMLALLKRNGIDERSIIKVPHVGDPQDLINGKADVMIGYSFNEPFALEQVGEPYLTFSPLTYGIDFYGDNLFTTGTLISSKPAVVQAFREATLRGWRYALANKEEIADIILAKYSKEKSREWLLFEADQVQVLIQPDLVELGYQSPSRWQQVAKVFVGLGMLSPSFDPIEVMYTPPTPPDYRPLVGTIAVAALMVAILAYLVMFFRRLNLRLRQEVAERERALTALQESEQRFRNLFERSPVAYQSLDKNGCLLEANEAWCRLLGYEVPEVLGSWIGSYLTDDSVTLLKERFPRFSSNGAISNADFQFVRKDGFIVDVSVEGRVSYDPQGGLRQTHCMLYDVSERKRVEQQLRDAYQRTQEIVQSIPSGLFIYEFEDPDRLVLQEGNQAAEKLTGLTVQDHIGQEFNELWPAARQAGITDAYLAVIRTGEPFETEDLFYRDNRLEGAFSICAFRMSGNRLGVAFENITERKQAEIALRLLNEQLEQRVAERTKELESFSYSISHDLRTPLRAIDGYTGILRSDYAGSLDEEGQELCRRISSNAVRMGQLIEDLLTFSRSGQLALQVVEVDMTLLVRSVFEELVLPEERQHVDFRLAELPNSWGDRTMLRQVWVNLLGNALKYSSTRSQALITVAGEQTGGEVIYSVKDNGVGFDMAYADKLFGVFQRLHSMQEFTGTGVGLAIVERVVKRHGGRVWAEAAVNQGATFYVALPAVRPALPN